MKEFLRKKIIAALKFLWAPALAAVIFMILLRVTVFAYEVVYDQNHTYRVNENCYAVVEISSKEKAWKETVYCAVDGRIEVIYINVVNNGFYYRLYLDTNLLRFDTLAR